MYKVYEEINKDEYLLIDETNNHGFKYNKDSKDTLYFTNQEKKVLLILIENTYKCINASSDDIVNVNHIPFCYFQSCFDREYTLDEWADKNSAARNALKACIRKIRDNNSIFNVAVKNERGKGYYLNCIVEYIEDTKKNPQECDSQNRTDTSKGQWLSELFNCSKEVYCSWFKTNSLIDTFILPTCRLNEGKTKYVTLFDCIDNELHYNNKKHFHINATGGSGKTSSLINIWGSYLGNDDELVIPLYVETKYLNNSSKNPILGYLFQQYAPVSDAESINDVEKFQNRLGYELRSTNKRLLVILDGVISDNCVDDIEWLSGNDKVVLVLAARLLDERFMDYTYVYLNKLTRKVVVKYLDNQGIKISRNYSSLSLDIPIYLTMYSDICKKNKDQDNKKITISTQAELINEWVSKQYSGLKWKKNDELVIDFIFPVMALYIYMESDLEANRKGNYSIYDHTEVLKKVSDLLNGPHRTIFFCKYGKVNYSEDDLLDLFRECVARKCSFMQESQKEIGVFEWSHECIRDWFIAKGLFALFKYARDVFDQIFAEFMLEKFNYLEVFWERKDYSSFSVAVYFEEMVEKENIQYTDIDYEKMIRNIAFFYDEMGDADNVRSYGKKICKRLSDGCMDHYVVERALTYSGLAASYSHIHDLFGVEEQLAITKEAHDMMRKALNDVGQVLHSKYLTLWRTEIIEAPKLMELHVEDILHIVHDKCEPLKGEVDVLITPDELKEKMPQYSEDDITDIIRQKDEILPLLARLFGNMASYHLNKHTDYKDKNNISVAKKCIENLSEKDSNKHKDQIDALNDYLNKIGDEEAINASLYKAYRYHFIGLLYKKISLDRASEDKHNKAKDALAVSLNSLGIDIYHQGNYQLSIEYFEKALEEYATLDKTKLYLKRNIIRSKVKILLTKARVKQQDIEVITSLVAQCSDLMKEFNYNHMHDGIDRMLNIVQDFIELYKRTKIIELKDALTLLYESMHDIGISNFVNDGKYQELLSGL